MLQDYFACIISIPISERISESRQVNLIEGVDLNICSAQKRQPILSVAL